MPQPKPQFEVVSAFAGIEGFGVGLEAAGMTVTTQIEWDPNCQTILRRHYPHTTLLGDIHDVRGTDLGRPKLYCGGFPCNDTAIAAPHRAGLAGHRSGHFIPFIRLLHETQRVIDESDPEWVVIENPDGLLASPGRGRDGVDRTGWDMAAVIRALEDLGYGWAYRVVDARHFRSPDGRRTPQRRRRVLVVGHRGPDPRPAGEVLGLTPDSREVDPPRRVRRRPLGPAPAGGAAFDAVWRKSARARASLANGGYETWVSDGAANTLTGFDGGGPARQTHLLAQHGRLRTLTCLEWERLQGLPDGWTEGIPESDVRRDGVLIRAGRFTMLGNAIHTGTSYWLGRRLMSVHAALQEGRINA